MKTFNRGILQTNYSIDHRVAISIQILKNASQRKASQSTSLPVYNQPTNQYTNRKRHVNFVRLEKTVTEMAIGCLRTMKSGHICIKQLKGSLLFVKKIWVYHGKISVYDKHPRAG